MEVYAVALLAAIVIVPLTRGSFRRLVDVELRQVWALFLALAIQISLEFDWLPEDRWDTVGFGLLMASYALIIAFAIVNLGRRGIGVILIGILMNTAVIGVNRGMPYRAPAGSDDVVTVKHHPETDDDLIAELGDIIVLPEPWSSSISFGDLVIAVGLVDFCFWASRKPKRREADDGGLDGDDEPTPEPEPEPDTMIVLDAEPVDITEDTRERVTAGGVKTLWSMDSATARTAPNAPTDAVTAPESRDPAWRDR